MQNSISKQTFFALRRILYPIQNIFFGAYLNSLQITALCYMVYKVNQNKYTYTQT